MAFTSIPQDDIDVKKPITKTLWQMVKDNFDFLFGAAGGDGTTLENASFENDADASGEPDSWTRATYPAGTVERTIVTADVAHGLAAVKMVHPGGASNGGGTMESDYVGCSEYAAPFLRFLHKATAAGMKNQIVFRYYDEAKVTLGVDETVYSSTANPTSYTELMAVGTPPAGVRFMKVLLIGGFTDTDVAGTAYFDGLELDHSPLPTAGDLYGQTYAVASLGFGSVAATGGIFVRLKIPVSGTYRTILSTSWAGLSTTTSMRIYKNGAAFGTLRSRSFPIGGGSGKIEYTEDLTFAKGDTCDLWVDPGDGNINATLALISGAPCKLKPHATLLA